MRKDDWAAAYSIFDERGQLGAIAEVKAKPGIDLGWARDWLQIRLERERLAGPGFVLLITPDTMFLWKHGAEDTWPAPLTADAREILAPYVSPRTNLDTISKEAFEFLVGGWLEHFVYGLWKPTAPDQVNMFVDSGFFEAIENGRVESHIFA